MVFGKYYLGFRVGALLRDILGICVLPGAQGSPDEWMVERAVHPGFFFFVLIAQKFRCIMKRSAQSTAGSNILARHHSVKQYFQKAAPTGNDTQQKEWWKTAGISMGRVRKRLVSKSCVIFPF
ncbi:hypothetical protein QBC36DRAFT_60101 [Triangularia setosa]|uniref:Uncharacterized protein n=1 Tax=Triangularia setosa TaxID=2587417 RepID=A0AAN6W2S6_9PEZI|nr:hypothetical protein QBC36DRAFT_60101 [Podospora setosa]